MGRFIALSEEKVIPASEAGKNPMKKREVYLDCTAVDYYTQAQIGSENKVLLELGGDNLLDKAVALGMQKGDVVAVTFGLQGNAYKDKTTGKNRVFTAIRVLDIEITAKAGRAVVAQPVAPQPATQPATQQAPAPQPEPAPAPEPQNTDDNGGLPF